MSDPDEGGGSVTGLDSDAGPATTPGLAPFEREVPSHAKIETDDLADPAAATVLLPATPATSIPPLAVAPPSTVAPLTKAQIKERFGKTSIGIAPPGLGSKAPPAKTVPSAVSPLNAASPAHAASATVESPIMQRPTDATRRARSAPPPPLPSGRPSRPPPTSRPPSAKPLGTSESASASAFMDTLIAVAPPPPRVPDDGATRSSDRRMAVAPRTGDTDVSPIVPPPPPLPGLHPIVPRRRTPPGGMPIADTAPMPRVTPMAGTVMPKLTPMAGGAGPALDPVMVMKEQKGPPSSLPKPPIIRIPQGGMLGSSAPRRVAGGGTLLCEILLRNGSVTQEVVDKAIALQEERGGQIGRILVSLGACTEEAIARALIQQLKARKDEGGHASDISAAAREQKDVVGLKVLTRPTRTVVTLLLTDIFSLFLAALLATSVHWARTYSELQTIDFTAWLVVGPSIALCMLTFLGLELYSPMAKSTPDEIRDITFAASLVHLGASVLSTLGDLPIVKWGIFVRGVWWAATLFLVPVIRSIVRDFFSTQPWWGLPVCVLGAAKTGRLIVRTLKAQPRSGLKPVMMLDDDINKYGTLRASFTNEVMDVYSVNVSSSHFLSDAQRAEYSTDIFGDDEDDRGGGPISSDHIPVAPRAGQNKVDVIGTPVNGRPRSSPPPRMTPSSPPPSPGGEFFGPEDQKMTRSQITKDASLFTRGKFAEVDGVPLVGDLSLAPILAHRLKIPYAVLAMPGVDSAKLLEIVERIGGKFTHLLIIPDLFGFATMGVPAKSLGGILGVEVRQQLLLPGPRLAKRCMDVALTGLGSLFVLPFLLLIAALIKIDSRGPVFYTQKRLGMNGDHFNAYKFRTMHGDGEERLKAILEGDPALRAEYEIYHKLRKDPRVTRIGRVLRKFSLDEFPQLLNVILGDMSLVGPRPYIEREITEMGGQEKIILRAPPGMTGMWQVSDRNATSFAQRVMIDVYYVRNWSPWLDIHILAKTFGVVMRGSGV